MFDVGEKPVTRRRRAAELHCFWESVIAGVSVNPHGADAEAFAHLADGQVACIIGDANLMFDS